MKYSYIRAKEDELSKTRAANENFMMNKFEATFGRFIEKSKTSAGTGLIGEGFVEQILSKIGFGIHYENVARWGHQGDFKVVFPKSQVTILLEVKNFSDTQTSLPRKDIDKFFLDLKDSSYHAGEPFKQSYIFVNLDCAVQKSNIGKYRFHYSFTNYM